MTPADDPAHPLPDRSRTADASDAADAVLRPHTDALFWAPATLLSGARGYAYVPLYHWLVATLRPGCVVTLAGASHAGFAAFSEAMQRLDIPGACIAVSPVHDASAAAAAMRAATATRFASVGRREAAMPSGGIDLLHVDGVAFDPAGWADALRRLSAHGVVLVEHGPAGRTPLPRACAAFTFHHAGGLSVLCPGAVPPRLAAFLDAAESPAGARLRERFAALGTRWALAAEGLHETPEPARVELRAALASASATALAVLAAHARAHDAETTARVAVAENLTLRAERDLMQNSRAGRLARWLFATRGLKPRRAVVGPVGLPPPSPSSPPATTEAMPRRRPRVLFAGAEPETPGYVYRCVRMVEAAIEAGWDARCMWSEQVDGPALLDTDLVILWRVAWSEHIRTLIDIAHQHGARVGLDLDDLMLRPELARIEFIDAIRVLDWSEARVTVHFERVGAVLPLVDFCTATTDELADDMRATQRAAYVLPNTFNDEALRRSRLARRRRQDDGLVRIGYASGSRTHQRDFAEAAAALADVLRQRPLARLVLFQSADGRGVLLAHEFVELRDVADQIEWRFMVTLDDLPDEMARFDINIVPLQADNPFVEAKSELKFFEAALAGVVTIASPTGPYRRAIRDGMTGLLRTGRDGWREALLRLIDEPELRTQIARDAFHDVLWRFGPRRRAQALRRVLTQELAIARPEQTAEAASGFALGLGAAGTAEALPEIRPFETLFAHDALGEADVTVAVASYNYADFIQQALDSARLQSLAVMDLVVVDDCSTDPATLTQILDFAHAHAARFNRLQVLRHARNEGLGATRNAGFAAAETPYVMLLDADNRLRPDCCARLLAALTASGAAFSYSRLQGFGTSEPVLGGQPWEPQRLVGGNYIDAMALVAKWAWAAAGGYYVRRDAMGWEDFTLWCRLAELGQYGVAVPDILAEYRLQERSMVNSITETPRIKAAVVELAEQRHPWLRLVQKKPRIRADANEELR